MNERAGLGCATLLIVLAVLGVLVVLSYHPKLVE
jgi:hypothetical protein